MPKYYSFPLKIISIITLVAFMATQCGLGYAYSEPAASKIRQTNTAQSEAAEAEIASAIGAPAKAAGKAGASGQYYRKQLSDELDWYGNVDIEIYVGNELIAKIPIPERIRHLRPPQDGAPFRDFNYVDTIEKPADDSSTSVTFYHADEEDIVMVENMPDNERVATKYLFSCPGCVFYAETPRGTLHGAAHVLGIDKLTMQEQMDDFVQNLPADCTQIEVVMYLNYPDIDGMEKQELGEIEEQKSALESFAKKIKAKFAFARITEIKVNEELFLDDDACMIASNHGWGIYRGYNIESPEQHSKWIELWNGPIADDVRDTAAPAAGTAPEPLTSFGSGAGGANGAGDAASNGSREATALVSNNVIRMIDTVLAHLGNSLFQDENAVKEITELKLELETYRQREVELEAKVKNGFVKLEELFRLRVEILEAFFAREEVLRKAMEAARVQVFPDGSRGIMPAEEVDDFNQSMRQVSEGLKLLREHLEKPGQAPAAGTAAAGGAEIDRVAEELSNASKILDSKYAGMNLRNVIRNYWDELQELCFDDLGFQNFDEVVNRVRRHIDSELLTDDTAADEVVKFLYSFFSKDSYFLRHSQQVEAFKEEFERKIIERQHSSDRGIDISVFGPGFMQEPIDIYIAIQEVLAKHGLKWEDFQIRIRVFDFEDQTGLFDKIRTNTVYYDPQDVQTLRDSNVVPDEYFTLEERGYRLRDDIHKKFEFVPIDLRTLDENTPVPQPQQDFIFCNVVLEHLQPSQRDEALRYFYNYLRDDGIFYSIGTECQGILFEPTQKSGSTICEYVKSPSAPATGKADAAGVSILLATDNPAQHGRDAEGIIKSISAEHNLKVEITPFDISKIEGGDLKVIDAIREKAKQIHADRIVVNIDNNTLAIAESIKSYFDAYGIEAVNITGMDEQTAREAIEHSL